MVAVRSAVFACLAPLVALASCGPKAVPRASEPTPPSPQTTRAAKVVNATIVANGCQNLGPASARLAERAMYDLVEGCTAVPGGTAGFHAILRPGGRIEIAAGPGQPDTIPICVLKHSLVHKVPLTGPCGLDVKLDETTMAVTRDAGSPL
jgi:hypothetical protein